MSTYATAADMEYPASLVYGHFGLTMAVGWLALALRDRSQVLLALAMLLLGGTFLRSLGEPHPGLSMLVADTLAKTIIIFTLHVTSLLALERWALPSPKLPWRARLYAAYKILWNSRWIGSRMQAPYTPTPRPSQVGRSRWAFVRGRLLHVVFLLFIDGVHSGVFHRLVGFHTEDYIEAHETFLRRLPDVTGREASIRANAVLSVYFLSRPLTYVLLHDVLACVFVGLGLDEPHEWPPLFGSISEAYTVRRYWSHFCDRLLYRPLTLWLKFLLRVLFGFGTPLRPWVGSRRHLLNFLTFLSSGVMHAWSLRLVGLTCGGRQEVLFWCLNFAVIAGESLVERFVSPLRARVRSGQVPGVLEKGIGYLWVFAFFFWASPKFQYVQMRCIPDHYN